MRRYFLLFLMSNLFLFSGPHLGGQTLWSLHDCMLYAVEHAPEHKIQELTNQNNNRNLRDAVLGMLPSVSGNISGSFNNGRSISQEDNSYINNTSFSNQYGLSASAYLFNGFQAINRVRVAKIARLQGIEESQRIADEISLNTLQCYFNVVHAHGLVLLAREQLTESRQRLKNTRAMEELGLKGAADVLQIEAEVATQDFNLTQQENLLADNLLQLKETMFFPIDEPLQIDTTVRWEINLLDQRDSLGNIYPQALQHLPASKQAAMDVESARYQYHSAKWMLLPSLSVNGSYGTNYFKINGEEALSYKMQLEGKQSKSLGLTLSIPLFGGLSRQSQITRARNEMRIARHKQDQTLQEIEAAIQRALQEMEGKGKEYIQAVKTVMAEESAYKTNRRKYEEGLISILDLQTSANRLLDAKVKRLNALLGYQIKRREVTYYKGTPYLDQAF